MGWLSDRLFGKRKKLDTDKVDEYMQPTQNLINEQLGMVRQQMDPNSEMNQNMMNMMQDRAFEQNREAGAQSAMQVRQLAAQTGMSSGQAAMQQRMAMNQKTQGVDDSMMKYLSSQWQSGLGSMGGISQMQQGMNENSANAYVQQINAHNAARESRIGMITGLAGAALQGSLAGRNTGPT